MASSLQWELEETTPRTSLRQQLKVLPPQETPRVVKQSKRLQAQNKEDKPSPKAKGKAKADTLHSKVLRQRSQLSRSVLDQSLNVSNIKPANQTYGDLSISEDSSINESIDLQSAARFRKKRSRPLESGSQPDFPSDVPLKKPPASVNRSAAKNTSLASQTYADLSLPDESDESSINASIDMGRATRFRNKRHKPLEPSSQANIPPPNALVKKPPKSKKADDTVLLRNDRTYGNISDSLLESSNDSIDIHAAKSMRQRTTRSKIVLSQPNPIIPPVLTPKAKKWDSFRSSPSKSPEKTASPRNKTQENIRPESPKPASQPSTLKETVYDINDDADESLENVKAMTRQRFSRRAPAMKLDLSSLMKDITRKHIEEAKERKAEQPTEKETSATPADNRVKGKAKDQLLALDSSDEDNEQESEKKRSKRDASGVTVIPDSQKLDDGDNENDVPDSNETDEDVVEDGLSNVEGDQTIIPESQKTIARNASNLKDKTLDTFIVDSKKTVIPDTQESEDVATDILRGNDPFTIDRTLLDFIAPPLSFQDKGGAEGNEKELDVDDHLSFSSLGDDEEIEGNISIAISALESPLKSERNESSSPLRKSRRGSPAKPSPPEADSLNKSPSDNESVVLTRRSLSSPRRRRESPSKSIDSPRESPKENLDSSRKSKESPREIINSTRENRESPRRSRGSLRENVDSPRRSKESPKENLSEKDSGDQTRRSLSSVPRNLSSPRRRLSITSESSESSRMDSVSDNSPGKELQERSAQRFAGKESEILDIRRLDPPSKIRESPRGSMGRESLRRSMDPSIRESPRKSMESSNRTRESLRKSMDSPKRTMDSPKRTMDSPKRTMDSPERIVDSPERIVDSPKRIMDSPKRIMESSERTTDSPQKSMDSSRKGIHSPKRTVDSPRKNRESSRKSLINKGSEEARASLSSVKGKFDSPRKSVGMTSTTESLDKSQGTDSNLDNSPWKDIQLRSAQVRLKRVDEESNNELQDSFHHAVNSSSMYSSIIGTPLMKNKEMPFTKKNLLPKLEEGKSSMATSTTRMRTLTIEAEVHPEEAIKATLKSSPQWKRKLDSEESGVQTTVSNDRDRSDVSPSKPPLSGETEPESPSPAKQSRMETDVDISSRRSVQEMPVRKEAVASDDEDEAPNVNASIMEENAEAQGDSSDDENELLLPTANRRKSMMPERLSQEPDETIITSPTSITTNEPEISHSSVHMDVSIAGSSKTQATPKTPQTAASSSNKQMTMKEFLQRLAEKPMKAQSPPNRERLHLSSMLRVTKKPSTAKKVAVVEKTDKKKVKKELPKRLSKSSTRDLFSHFAKCRLSPDGLEELLKISEEYWKNCTSDLAKFVTARKGGHEVRAKDVKKLMGRQKLVNTEEDLQALVEQYLSAEDWNRLIPTAYAMGYVYPLPDE